jgi:hypothetical protein
VSHIDLVPCALCGDSPLGSLTMDGPRGDLRISGTIYTCLGEDCENRGETKQGDHEARLSWNERQALLKTQERV